VVVVTVRNPQEAADTHLVELELFGQVVNSRTVAVPAGGRTTVEFVHNIVAPGSYTARVDSETATVRVLDRDGTPASTPAATTSTQFPGFGFAAALAALASVLVAARLSRQA
jgi:hypothetical protein